MADEIAEVVKVELEGIEMVVKGSVAAVTGLLKGITAIYRFEKESKDKKDEKKLNEAGEKSMAEMMKFLNVRFIPVLCVPYSAFYRAFPTVNLLSLFISILYSYRNLYQNLHKKSQYQCPVWRWC